MRMNKSSEQKGFMRVMIVGLVLVGLAVTVSPSLYASLDQKTHIEFLDETEQLITKTKTQKIKIRLVYVPKPSSNIAPAVSPSATPTQQIPVPTATNPLAPIGANREKINCHAKSTTDTMIVCDPIESEESNVKGVSTSSNMLEFPTKFRITNNDSANLAKAQAQGFIQNKMLDWQLSKGKGAKQVYVQFGNGRDNITWEEPVSGSIMLEEEVKKPIFGPAGNIFSKIWQFIKGIFRLR